MPTYVVIYRAQNALGILVYGMCDMVITSEHDPHDPTPIRTFELFEQMQDNIAARNRDQAVWKGQPPSPDNIIILNVFRLPM